MRNSSLPLQKSIQIPASSMGLITGKKGSTISRLQQMPGVVSVQLNTLAMSVTVTGVSVAPVDSVLREIRKLCSFSINKDRSFVPDFIIICYQSNQISSPFIRLEPLKIPGESNSLIFPSYDSTHRKKVACTWFPAEPSESSCKAFIMPSSADRSPTGKKTRTSSIPVGTIAPEDYQSVVLNCFSSIGFQALEGTTVKVEVKLGKYLFLCERSHLGRIEAPLPMNVVDKMVNSSGKTLSPKFCDSHTTQDITILVDHLLASGYSKSPAIKHKASVHLIDFRMLTKHFVSMNVPPDQAHNLLHSKQHFRGCHRVLECSGSPGTAEDRHQWRFLRLPRRRGFVLGLHPGKAADVRLSVLTRETENAPSEELRAWVEEAWSSRSRDGLLNFDPDKRFHIASARYKEVHKFLLEDFVVRVAKIAASGENDMDFKWEVALKSRWLRSNLVSKHELQVANMSTAMEKLHSLVEEANRIARAIPGLHLLDQQ